MKKYIYFFTISILGLFCEAGIAQSSGGFNSNKLLQELEEKLFPRNKEYIKITEIIGCENQKIDSVYLIRKNQPNTKEVLFLLEKMTFTRDTHLINPLLSIYRKQIDLFRKEWEHIHDKNFYACDFAKEQFKILSGFEVALHSLQFNKLNLTAEEKYAYHKERIKLNYRVFKEKSNRMNLIDGYPVSDLYYKKIKRKYWFAFQVYFDYLSPYLEEVKDYFIEDFENYVFDSPTLNFERFFITNSESYLSKIQDKELESIIFKRFDHWAEHDYHGYLYSIAGKRNSTNSLLNFLVQRLIDEQDKVESRWNSRNLFLGYLCRNPSNKEKIKQYLFKKIVNTNQKNKVDILKYLKQFRDQETIDKINLILKKEKLTDEEREEAKRTKDFISNLITSK